MYPGCFGDWYTGLGAQNQVPKKHFSSFLFSVYFNEKYVEVVINDFIVYLIILK